MIFVIYCAKNFGDLPIRSFRPLGRLLLAARGQHPQSRSAVFTIMVLEGASTSLLADESDTDAVKSTSLFRHALLFSFPPVAYSLLFFCYFILAVKLRRSKLI